MRSFLAATAVVFCLLPGAVHSARAQTSDQEAIVHLRALRDHYAAFKTMALDFSLEIADLESDLLEIKRGSMLLQGPKFRVQLDDQLVISDNQTIWVYLEEVNEVQITDFEPDSEEFMSPAELFNLPESEYYITQGEVRTEAGKRLQVLELTPLDKNLDFHKIKLAINKADRSLYDAVILDKNGIRYTYRITQFKGNPSLPGDAFRFPLEKHPNAEVVDLRQ